MGQRLPTDLDRLGDHLAAAAARSAAARRRRAALLARLAATAVAAVLAMAALAPSRLAPAERAAGTRVLLASAPATPVACDEPRGGRFAVPACRPEPAVTLGRPRRW
jgi:hypothetical protein